MAGLLTMVGCVALVIVQEFTLISLVDAQTDSGSMPMPSIKDALLSYMCRGTNSRICSGNGQCRNGMCSCYTGYSGPFCEVQDYDNAPMTSTTQPETVAPPRVTIPPCSPADRIVCSGHGVCLEGACKCDPNWSGSRCELSMRDGFCKAHLECAECTALMQKCPPKCATQAVFRLVYGFPIGPTFHRCKHRDIARNCVFYYQLEREGPDGQKDITVKACIPQPIVRPETTQATPDTDDDEDDNRAGNQERKRGGDSGASGRSSDLLLVLGAIVLLLA